VDGVDAKAYAKANELQRINENQKKRARFFDEEPSTLSGKYKAVVCQAM